MKLFLISVSLLLLTIPSMKGSPIIDEGRIVITGKIINQGSQTIKLISLELMGRENHTVKLDEQGRFYFDIKVSSAHDNFLSHGNQLITFFAHPNDSIHLEFDYNQIDNSVIFFGDGSSLNNCLRGFFLELGKFLRKSSFFAHQRDDSPSEFKELCNHFQNHMTDKVDSIKRHMGPSSEAIGWMNAYIKYKAAEELMQYGRHHKEELPPDYFDFLDELENPDKQDLKCSQFYEDFLNELQNFRIAENLDDYDQVKSHMSNGDTLSGLKSYLELVHYIFPNRLSQDLMLTRAFYGIIHRYSNFTEVLFPLYEQLVQNDEYLKYMKQQLHQSENPNNPTKTIDDLADLDFVGEVFSAIKDKHPNKVLYIDMWGTWCKACIMQFQFSKELHEILKDAPIEFVYLCCESKEDKWKESVDKYSLSGTHFLLTNEQYSILSSEFNFSGLPHYLLIDKLGVVVDGNAKSPNNDNLLFQLQYLISQ